MELNVSNLAQGSINLSNKASRVEGLLEEARRLEQSGSLRRSQAASLRCKLSFINSFVARSMAGTSQTLVTGLEALRRQS